MKSSKFIMLAVFITFNASSAFTKECPDEMRINQLPPGKTFLTVMDAKGLSTKNSSYDCHSGVCKREKIISLKDFVNRGRFIRLGIQEDFTTNLQNETYVFEGPMKDSWTDSNKVDDIRFRFLNVKYRELLDEKNSVSRSEIRFYQDRSTFDLRQKFISYGSLKYNLGQQFKITAECAD